MLFKLAKGYKNNVKIIGGGTGCLILILIPDFLNKFEYEYF